MGVHVIMGIILSGSESVHMLCTFWLGGYCKLDNYFGRTLEMKNHALGWSPYKTRAVTVGSVFRKLCNLNFKSCNVKLTEVYNTSSKTSLTYMIMHTFFDCKKKAHFRKMLSSIQLISCFGSLLIKKFLVVHQQCKTISL